MYKYSDNALQSFKKKSINFWSGKIFNNCRILEPVDFNKVTANHHYKIECFCGTVFEGRPNNFQSGNSKSCGCLRNKSSKERILKLHKSKRIERGYDENFYISEVTDFVRRDLFKLIKSLVFKIDDYTCNLCLIKGGNLTVHHIIPINIISSYSKKENFKLVYSLNNLITLCHTCHKEKAHLNNFLDINYDIQEYLQELIIDRPISKYINEYNVIKLNIEDRIDRYLMSLPNV